MLDNTLISGLKMKKYFAEANFRQVSRKKLITQNKKGFEIFYFIKHKNMGRQMPTLPKYQVPLPQILIVRYIDM